MAVQKKKLPIGIENFEKLLKEDFYYVDKTNLIKEILGDWAEVNLFTRPRRFGKSLNMSMLKSFFSSNGNKELFQKLEISKETSLCEKYMGQFPVVSISLKGIHADSYEKACGMASHLVCAMASEFQYLLDSDNLTPYDKERLIPLLRADMDDTVMCSSLKVLSELLEKHHGRKVIILIDEYDVPLAKAFDQGYYSQMAIFMRNLFENALKTNNSLQFAVLTGCMRISKESIFTGLNNLKVLSITDVQFDEYFGFTDTEVRSMLEYYGFPEKYQEVHEWYDGYQFGNTGIYCPWDVINYCDALRVDYDAPPKNYWVNSSSNDAVKRFIQESDKAAAARKEVEKLVAGEFITKEVYQELTYQDMYDSIENLWSILFTTGYLTKKGRPERNRYDLAIPNMEIREVFTHQIMALFRENVPKNGEALKHFCDALQTGDAEGVESLLCGYLKRTISIRDTFVKTRMKENFYHGILLGILSYQAEWIVSSNKESGYGYSDILIETEDGDTGIVLEIKYAGDGRLVEACKEALGQIGNLGYAEALLDEGICHIIKYGIAFYKKKCRVMVQM